MFLEDEAQGVNRRAQVLDFHGPRVFTGDAAAVATLQVTQTITLKLVHVVHHVLTTSGVDVDDGQRREATVHFTQK